MNTVLLIWIFLRIVMSVNGEDKKMNSLETKLFSASITCQPSYKAAEHVKCSFILKNDDTRAYSVLMSNTPMRAKSPLGLLVTRDGTKLEFRGIMQKREYPIPKDFQIINGGKSLSKAIDLSSGYDTTKPGMYTVAVDTYLEYVEGSVQPPAGDPEIETKLVHLSSPPAKFQVVL
ncbi:uncharacterized protein LOC122946893 isoform X2 [Acropora millepora]|nr:uncharacterized protein LOC114958852 isoform X2 [Acropora millepora]XP_029192545.1 uncharacterized protein LOC114958852 isoform X2 [Acropora millepora]XP_029192546.1 uncharacterized protein LOC114958852 isoform X2 [Acropora millepora]XP_044172128.1 uncharacterized protein LOC122946893 isoform X2 [Acropora millepora]XP_044172129.1 uncharacterized protein LOC122946893 isoform X2 [Acropora millepora]XP_044172130.1 uncharacterized protein LOC122946893 isoform X2 [Acropora millepora]